MNKRVAVFCLAIILFASTTLPAEEMISLALNKPAEVSSQESANYPAAKAVDGDRYSRWSSAFGEPQWFVVDLETEQTIRCVAMLWESAFGRVYDIQVSNNAADWTTIYSESGGNGGTDIVVFDAVNTRYVRMYGVQRGTQYGFSFYEFLVFAEPVTEDDLKETIEGKSLDIFSEATNALLAANAAATYGLSFVDYDGDGWMDIFCSNPSNSDNIFHNKGNGEFESLDIDEMGLASSSLSSGVAWGDYDNDGDPDLYVPKQGGINAFFRNVGGKSFTRITEAGPGSDTNNSFDATWIDLDKDGRLDLVVSNVRVMGVGDGIENSVYHNNGDGTFTSLNNAVAADLSNNTSTSWTDIDNDGDLDCFIPDFGLKDKLYINNNDGSFTAVTNSPVVDYEGISISGQWADYDNDMDMDLFIATGYPDARRDVLFNNNGDGTFVKVTEGDIVNIPTPCWNGSWGDFDNDGDLDIYLCTLPGNNILYQNNGDGTFIRIIDDVSVSSTFDACTAIWGDVDKDGDLDLVANDLTNAVNHLYLNKGNGNHWLDLACTGTVSNRSALGTRIKAKAKIAGHDVWQMREVTDSNGFRQRSFGYHVHLGLGDAAIVDSLIILWPSGQQTIMTNVPADQFLSVTEEMPEGFIRVGFDAEQSTGLSQLTVRFHDRTQTHPGSPVITRAWDFNGDGVNDATDADPEFTFESAVAVDFPVKLAVSNGAAAPFVTIPNFIRLNGYKSIIELNTDMVNLGTLNTATEAFFLIYNNGDMNDTIQISIPSRFAGQITLNPDNFALAFQDSQQVAIHIDPNLMTANKDYSVSMKIQSLHNLGVNSRTKTIRFSTGDLTLVDADRKQPLRFALLQNYPNPFNPETVINYSLANREWVNLSVYDLTGRQVLQLVNREQQEGVYSVVFDGKSLPSSVYYYKLVTRSFQQTRKMLLLR
ncbi:MAG TPA: FG-GAP-like repeat-containing protein [bacterium]|nr:FG-GAP-like repeat-containing protein [bacterium]HPN44063.1 FG-GAP-like repeat-containing protein [bacterium]